MTLTELRYIVALAQENNFSRAAERCSVSQPTLSVAIARLEDELGVQLFAHGTYPAVAQVIYIVHHRFGVHEFDEVFNNLNNVFFR